MVSKIKPNGFVFKTKWFLRKKKKKKEKEKLPFPIPLFFKRKINKKKKKEFLLLLRHARKKRTRLLIESLTFLSFVYSYLLFVAVLDFELYDTSLR